MEKKEIISSTDSNADAATLFKKFYRLMDKGTKEDVIQYLDSNKELINMTDPNLLGYTLLHIVFIPLYGSRSIVEIGKYLIENGINLNAQTETGGSTFLHFAANIPLWMCEPEEKKEILDVIALGIDKGADVKAEDCFGRTAFDIAKLSGESATAELLK